MGQTAKKLRETGKKGPACSGENISFHIIAICDTCLTCKMSKDKHKMKGAGSVFPEWWKFNRVKRKKVQTQFQLVPFTKKTKVTRVEEHHHK